MLRVSLITFSPTGRTKLIAETVAQGIGQTIGVVDLSAQQFTPQAIDADVAVIAMPVYGGRVPAVALSRMAQLQMTVKRAVTIVVYGNRAWEDALLELNDAVLECGVSILASAAAVAEHSCVRKIAAGRPNATDLGNLTSFGKVIALRMDSTSAQAPNVPGNRPYKVYNKAPVTPLNTEQCVHCGLCALQCPVGAIEVTDLSIDPERCILCQRCVSVCPTKARVMPAPVVERIEGMLMKTAAEPKENEYFWA